MNVSQAVPRNQYNATAGQTTFVYDYPIVADSDLLVYYTAPEDIPSDVADLLVLNVQYTVTGTGSADGGTIVLISPEFPDGAVENAIVTIMRSTPIERITQFTQGETIRADDLNDALNSITRMIQDVKLIAKKISPFYENADVLTQNRDLVLPVLPKDHFWKMSSSGNGIEAVQIDESGDWSTLRSELSSQSTGAPGTDLIGVGADQGGPQTLTEKLNSLSGFLPILDDVVQFANASDTTKRLLFDCSGLPSSTVTSISVSNLQSNIFVAGMTMYSVLPSMTGWLLMQNGTIGNVSSNATLRANADAQDLFTAIWENSLNTDCPIFSSTGAFTTRGATAIDDFNANKALSLPINEGRGLINVGNSSFTAEVLPLNSSNEFQSSNYYTDISENLLRGTVIQFSSTGTLPTGILAATNYYVIPVNSTTFQVASSVANAIAGTPVTFTDNGTGVISYTRQDKDVFNTVAKFGGELEHFQLNSEVGVHNHDISFIGATGPIPGSDQNTLPSPSSSGTNASWIENNQSAPTGMSILTPNTALYLHIKL